MLSGDGIFAAPSERRIALVFGNNKYQHIESLENAGNDAHAMAKELEAHGFTVIAGYDLTRSQMLEKVNAFTDQLPRYDVAVFYYSGHGMQIRGSNWLIPTDVTTDVSHERDLEDKSVSVADLTDRMSEANHQGFLLLIIDACRNNPFPSTGKGIAALPGLAPTQANGMMVLYSAGSNQTALDSLDQNDHDPNGVFTRVLLREMRQPGLRVRDMVTRLRETVVALAATVHHEQNPALYDEARGDFMFTPREDSDEPHRPWSTPQGNTAFSQAPAPAARPLQIVPHAPPRPRPPRPAGGGLSSCNPNDIATSLVPCQ
jgi:uncharacterized caspase-like protein